MGELCAGPCNMHEKLAITKTCLCADNNNKCKVGKYCYDRNCQQEALEYSEEVYMDELKNIRKQFDNSEQSMLNSIGGLAGLWKNRCKNVDQIREVLKAHGKHLNEAYEQYTPGTAIEKDPIVLKVAFEATKSLLGGFGEIPRLKSSNDINDQLVLKLVPLDNSKVDEERKIHKLDYELRMQVYAYVIIETEKCTIDIPDVFVPKVVYDLFKVFKNGKQYLAVVMEKGGDDLWVWDEKHMTDALKKELFEEGLMEQIMKVPYVFYKASFYHGDLKPNNILYGDKKVFIIDYAGSRHNFFNCRDGYLISAAWSFPLCKPFRGKTHQYIDRSDESRKNFRSQCFDVADLFSIRQICFAVCTDFYGWNIRPDEFDIYNDYNEEQLLKRLQKLRQGHGKFKCTEKESDICETKKTYDVETRLKPLAKHLRRAISQNDNDFSELAVETYDIKLLQKLVGHCLLLTTLFTYVSLKFIKILSF